MKVFRKKASHIGKKKKILHIRDNIRSATDNTDPSFD